MDCSKVLFLIPLDAGESFLFHANVQPNLDKSAQMQAQWCAAFPEKCNCGTWCADEQFPAKFSKPLGWISRLKLDADDARVREVLGRNTWIEDGTATVEIIFFTLGIGVLVLRADLCGDPLEAIERYWSEREQNRKFFADLLVAGANDFRDALDAAAAQRPDGGTIHKLPYLDLKDLGRDDEIREALYSYPLFLLSDQYAYKRLRRKALEQVGLDKSEPDYSYNFGKHVVKIHVGWAESYACGDWDQEEEDGRKAIEADFIIGLASWYSLVTMNRLVSRYLSRTFAELADHQRRDHKEESRAIRTIRLTYMETASASHPIRWTTRQRDLLLLAAIHRTWTSDELWRSVEERTALLSVHYEQLQAEANQLEAEANERRTLWLAGFGIGLACLALASAVADVLNLIASSGSETSKAWVNTYGVGISLALPGLAVLAGLVAGLVTWFKRTQRAG